jgi:hypothetical protein
MDPHFSDDATNLNDQQPSAPVEVAEEEAAADLHQAPYH